MNEEAHLDQGLDATDATDVSGASDDSYIYDMMAMQVAELRLACLRLADSNGGDAEMVVKRAEAYYDFVSCANEGDDA